MTTVHSIQWQGVQRVMAAGVCLEQNYACQPSLPPEIMRYTPTKKTSPSHTKDVYFANICYNSFFIFPVFILLHSDMLCFINSSKLQLCFSSQKHNDNIGIDRVAILFVPKKLCSHLVAVPGDCCKTRHEIQESLGSWH